ncbi:TPA: hypothetical protein KQE54_000192 [Clostridioides difficile]|nr:hypothetical protein [Clostridioides difficile]
MKGTEEFIREVLHNPNFANQCLRLYEQQDENFAQFLKHKGFIIDMADLDKIINKISQDDIFIWGGLYQFTEPVDLKEYILQISPANQEISLCKDKEDSIVLEVTSKKDHQFILNGKGELTIQFRQNYATNGLVDANTITGYWYKDKKSEKAKLSGKQILPTEKSKDKSEDKSEQKTWKIVLSGIGISSLISVLGAIITIKGYFNWCCGCCNKDGICRSRDCKDKKILENMRHEMKMRERFERILVNEFKNKITLNDVTFEHLNSEQRKEILNKCGVIVESWTKENEGKLLEDAEKKEALRICQDVFQDHLLDFYKITVKEKLLREENIPENVERTALIIAHDLIKDQQPFNNLDKNDHEYLYLEECINESIAINNELLFRDKYKQNQKKINSLIAELDKDRNEFIQKRDYLEHFDKNKIDEYNKLSQELEQKTAEFEQNRIAYEASIKELEHENSLEKDLLHEEQTKKENAHTKKELHKINLK